MKKLSVIFFGTHNFAAAILEGLIECPFISVRLVITQPDKPVGREQNLEPSPVKILAEKNNLKIEQPKSLKNYPDFVSEQNRGSSTPTKVEGRDQLGIVVQYGLLIPGHLINAPEHGILNVHTSLLPNYRGASPIQCALINGETETGVTIMKLDEGLDTGPILLQKSLAIEPDDTYPILEKKLSKIGLAALLETIPLYILGELHPKPQDEARASQCGQLSRDDGKIDWSKTATQIYNLYRGLTPWPGIWTTWNNKRLKLLKILPGNKKINSGKVLIENQKLFIGADGKSIEVLVLQLEGKRPMDAKEFINGYQNINGNILTN